MISDKLSREQIEGVHRLLEPAERVVILTHMSPDGDAMGSSLAVYWWLKETKQAQVIVPNVSLHFTIGCQVLKMCSFARKRLIGRSNSLTKPT